MRFKIVSTGWNCAQFMMRTLRSIERQTLSNWDVGIVYDPSNDNGSEIILNWCAVNPKNRICQINQYQKFGPRNQFEIIQKLNVQDDDIVVFLDLDGDQLADKFVFEKLKKAYEDGFLITYGQFKAVPDYGTSGKAIPFPDHVKQTNSFREHILAGRGVCFNHLRTIAGKVVKAIPEENFKMPNGDWLVTAQDYLFMIPALELTGGNYKCFDEITLLYNHDNPLADNKVHGLEARLGTRSFLERAPYAPIFMQDRNVKKEEKDMNDSQPIRYMSAEERREVLAEYGHRYNLKVFIETGTNDGGTPLYLKDQFDILYTIELGEAQWRRALFNLSKYPNIVALLGDSTFILPKVLKLIDQPALVWLDGHHSGGDTARGELDTPVVQELEALFADNLRHVILVDDARIFDGGPEHDDEPHYKDYPSLDWVRDYAHSHGFTYELKDDIIRLVPNELI